MEVRVGNGSGNGGMDGVGGVEGGPITAAVPPAFLLRQLAPAFLIGQPCLLECLRDDDSGLALVLLTIGEEDDPEHAGQVLSENVIGENVISEKAGGWRSECVQIRMRTIRMHVQSGCVQRAGLRRGDGYSLPFASDRPVESSICLARVKPAKVLVSFCICFSFETAA